MESYIPAFLNFKQLQRKQPRLYKLLSLVKTQPTPFVPPGLHICVGDTKRVKMKRFFSIYNGELTFPALGSKDCFRYSDSVLLGMVPNWDISWLG